MAGFLGAGAFVAVTTSRSSGGGRGRDDARWIGKPE